MVERIRFILDCHPNERVAKKLGRLVASELAQRGHQVEIISMPTTVEENGEKLPWWKSFARPGGLETREGEEYRIAETESPQALVFKFHDAPLEEGRGFIARILAEGFTFLVVELNAPWHQVSDPERVAAGKRAAEHLKPRQVRHITQESNPDDPEFAKRLGSSLVHRIANLVEEMGKEGWWEWI